MAESLKLMPPSKFDKASMDAFVRELNKRLEQVQRQFEQRDNNPTLKAPLDANQKRLTNLGKALSVDDALPLGQLAEALDDLQQDEPTSEGEEDGTGTTNRRTSRGRGKNEDDAEAALENAVPTVAPPKVVTGGGLGSTTDPVQFALSDHTHEGVNLDDAQTITGTKTFDLDPSAPFAVTSGSAVVTNLDADKVDGAHASATAGTADVAMVSNAGGTSDFNGRVAVRKNTGVVVGTRRRLNFIEGTDISLTVSDDGGNEEVDITITNTGGGGGGGSTSWSRHFLIMGA